MLYDTVGPALLATLEPDQFQSTLQITVDFLRPVRPGRMSAREGSCTERETLRSWRRH
jgi:acyl-coenzyme A thioesterase PaaI-like protein